MPCAVAAGQLRWIAAAFGCAVATYLMCSSPVAGAMPRMLLLLWSVGCLANPWLPWLLARDLFSGGTRLRWRHAWAIAAVLAVGMLRTCAS